MKQLIKITTNDFNYYKYYSSTLAPIYDYESILSEFRRRLVSTGSDFRVLEIGSAVNNLLSIFNRAGINSEGCEKFFDIAKNYLTPGTKKMIVHNCDFFDLSIEKIKEQYDAIIFPFSFFSNNYNEEEIISFLIQANKLCKNSGEIWIDQAIESKREIYNESQWYEIDKTISMRHSYIHGKCNYEILNKVERVVYLFSLNIGMETKIAKICKSLGFSFEKKITDDRLYFILNKIDDNAAAEVFKKIITNFNRSYISEFSTYSKFAKAQYKGMASFNVPEFNSVYENIIELGAGQGHSTEFITKRTKAKKIYLIEPNKHGNLNDPIQKGSVTYKYFQDLPFDEITGKSLICGMWPDIDLSLFEDKRSKQYDCVLFGNYGLDEYSTFWPMTVNFFWQKRLFELKHLGFIIRKQNITHMYQTTEEMKEIFLKLFGKKSNAGRKILNHNVFIAFRKSMRYVKMNIGIGVVKP